MSLENPIIIMDDPTDDSASKPQVNMDPVNIEDPATVTDEHDVFEPEKISLVSVVYIGSEGSETWVTDFNKLDIPKKMMEKFSTMETLALSDPTLDDVCAGKDPTDGQWYRVKIVALEPSVLVHYIDFGNDCEIPVTNLAVLPDELKIEPPLAKKVSLKWENPSVTDTVPCVGDVLEVKYDGKEGDGTLKFEVLAVQGISDLDDNLSDDGKCDALLGDVTNDVSNFTEEASLNQIDNNSAPASENLNELERLSVAVEQIEEVQAAATLRDEAHSTAQEILKKLDEEFSTQDKVAKQTRLEVEKTMLEIDNGSPLEDDATAQTRQQFQKIMEVLDERLQRQQEAALASMRQMVESAFAQPLSKIDRIQKDLHKLYASSRQQLRNQAVNPAAGVKETERGKEAAYQRNQYNRPITRNLNASTLDFSPDKRQQRFVHFGDNPSVGGGGGAVGSGIGFGASHASGHGANYGSSHGANYGANHGTGFGSGAGPGTGSGPLSPTSPRLGSRESHGPQYGSPVALQDSNANLRRPISLRLKQAGDYSVMATSILSVNNLPEIFTCDYLCTLFGLYGNVSRAKMLFNQKGKALVEMADAAQAAETIKNLDGAPLFGQIIHVRPSTFDKVSISPMELTNNTAKDNTRLNSYQANAVRRFKKGLWDPSRLAPPSESLRVTNILKTVPDEKVADAFTSKGFDFKAIRFYPGKADKKAAFVIFGSIEEAFKALHELHNTELSDWMPMKICFGINRKD